MTPLDLVGSWRLEREIDDRRAGERLTVTGTTVLQGTGPDVVEWREQGTLHRPRARPAAVHRTLRVVRREAGWWVVFDHGGDFHPWSPGVSVEHPCGADLYRGLVSVAPTGWQVTWEVTGPGKDYTMVSTLSPDPPIGGVASDTSRV